MIGFLWRLSVLTVCFAVFGIGGMIFRVTLFPAMRCLPGSSRERELRTRRLMHGCFAALIGILRSTGAMTLEISHPERLRNCGGKFILANHPSYLDVVVLLGLVPEANCVVKEGLWRSRYFGGVMRATGYVSNADPDRLVDDCAQVLQRGEPMLMFPEGTRSDPGKSVRFQRGAARIALRARCEIVPVVLQCEPPVWVKGFRLSRIARQRFHIRLDIESALRLNDLGIGEFEEEAKAARQLTRNLETYFSRLLARYEQSASGN